MMHNFSKIFLLASVAALTVSHLPNCAAGTETLALQIHADSRNYVGTITRTSSAGRKTTGDILLSVGQKGFVTATVTTTGKAHPYFGQVSPVARATKAAPNIGKQRTGTLTLLRFSPVPVPSASSANSFSEVQLSVTLTKNTAFGGTTTPNGSTVVFTATRVGAELSSRLPITVLPLPVTPIGTIISTPGNGG